MKQETKKSIIETVNSTDDYTPFVNKECGDTMWDKVLKEVDEKIKEAQWKGSI